MSFRSETVTIEGMELARVNFEPDEDQRQFIKILARNLTGERYRCFSILGGMYQDDSFTLAQATEVAKTMAALLSTCKAYRHATANKTKADFLTQMAAFIPQELEIFRLHATTDNMFIDPLYDVIKLSIARYRGRLGEGNSEHRMGIIQRGFLEGKLKCSPSLALSHARYTRQY